MKKAISFLSFSLCLFLLGCGDYRGASAPYSYAPETADSMWIPPKSIRKDKIAFDNVEPYELQDRQLTLAETIDITLVNNPLTKESWYEARSAASVYGQSLSKYFVLADFQSDYQNSRINSFNTIDPKPLQYINYEADVALSYTILDFGRRKASSSAARESLYQADFMHNRSLQEVVHSVMQSYYLYLSQVEQVKASEQDVYRAQVSLDAVMERFIQGTADIGDKAQAVTKLMQQKLNLVTQKKKQTTYYTNLLSSMGLPANAYLTFESYPEKLQLFAISDLSKLIKMATNLRPDLLAKEATVRSYEQRVKLAKAERYPLITGNFNYGRLYANIGSDHFNTYAGQLALTFPLFQGFRIENGIKKATADLEATKASLREMQLDLLQEVTSYYNDVLYAKESYFYAKEFLDAACADFKVNLEKYKMGTSTIVDLITSQTSVADAEYKLIDSERQWYTSIANLAFSVGILSNDPEQDQNLEEEGNSLNPCHFSKTADETL